MLPEHDNKVQFFTKILLIAMEPPSGKHPGPQHSQNHDGQPGQGTGRTMLLAGWILALIVLTFVFGEWEDHQMNPNRAPSTSQQANSREVTLQQNNSNHYVVPGKINRHPVIFLVDTGATDVVLSENLAHQINLPFGPRGTAITANGTVSTWFTRLESLEFANIQLTDIRASITPGMKGNEVLLGMSALKFLELSQKDDTLIIRQSMTAY
jgi:aspartyl protease family protein